MPIGAVRQAATQAGRSAPPGVQDYEFTGDFVELVYPTGYPYIEVELWGAQGGDGDSHTTIASGNEPRDPGGLGGYVKFRLTLPGQTPFRLYVGQRGHGGDISDDVEIRGLGGWNGGGDSGPLDENNYKGGGGGGATDLRVGPFTLEDRLAVAAGGGGGGGYRHYYGGGGGSGWYGGGGGSRYASGTHPTGGTQSSGGEGGSHSSHPGYPGGFGFGGDSNSTTGGSPGSGDRYGGGGGAGGAETGERGYEAGRGSSGNSWSGAGGSNYLDEVAGDLVETLRGIREGHGLARITIKG